MRPAAVALCGLLVATACTAEQIAALSGKPAGVAGKAKLKGTVVVAGSKNPLGGARVTVGPSTVVAGLDGGFEIADLPAGELLAKVERAGHESFNGTITITPGENTKEFALRPTGSGPLPTPSPSGSGQPSPGPSGASPAPNATATPVGTPTAWVPVISSSSAPSAAATTTLYATAFTPGSGTTVADFSFSITLNLPVSRPSFESAFKVLALGTLEDYSYNAAVAKDTLMLDKSKLAFTWTDPGSTGGDTVTIALAEGAYLPKWYRNSYIAVIAGDLTSVAGTTYKAATAYATLTVNNKFWKPGTNLAGAAFDLTQDVSNPRLTDLKVVRGATNDKLTATFSEVMKGSAAGGLTFGDTRIDDATNYWIYVGGDYKNNPSNVTWNAAGTEATLDYPAGTITAGAQTKLHCSSMRDPAGNYLANNGEIIRTL